MNCIETICLYLKQYISEEQFENIFYSNINEFEDCLDEYIYLDILSTNFTLKEERISLKTDLKDYVAREFSSLFGDINDAYVERMIDSDTGEDIVEILKKKYEKREEIDIDCSNIKTRLELINTVKKALQFPQFCGNNWNAIEDLIYDVIFPKKLVFLNWNVIEKNFSQDAIILKRILEKNGNNRCTIQYYNGSID